MQVATETAGAAGVSAATEQGGDDDDDDDFFCELLQQYRVLSDKHNILIYL